MTIYYRVPLFAQPMTFASSVSLRVVLINPGQSVTATIPAGTYYWTGDPTQAEDLGKVMADRLTAQEATDNTDGVWTAAYNLGPAEGRVLQLSLTRVAGDAADEVDELVFASSNTFPGSFAGWTSNTIAAPDHDAGDTVRFTSPAVRFSWSPGVPAQVGYEYPMRSGGVSVSGAGKARALMQTPIRQRPMTFEHVLGPRVLVDLLERGHGIITGLAATDVNACLEKWWEDVPDTGQFRHYPDKDDATTYSSWSINALEWLTDPVGTGQWELTESSLDYWRVQMPLAPYVA